jgi:hypothetical protein
MEILTKPCQLRVCIILMGVTLAYESIDDIFFFTNAHHRQEYILSQDLNMGRSQYVDLGGRTP